MTVIRILSIACVIFNSASFAQSEPLKSHVVSNHLLIDKNRSYPANSLCHDGNTLYFKNKAYCEENLESSCHDLQVASLLSLEYIYIDNERTKKIIRFYSIDLSFKVRIYTEIKPGSDSFVISGSFEETVPFCSEVKKTPASVAFSQRDANSEKERKWLRLLHNNGFDLINAPAGTINSLRLVNSQSSKLNTEKLDPDKLFTYISTPYCNSQIDTNLIHIMGGEISGNGLTATHFQFLESISREIVPTLHSEEESPITCAEEV